MSETAKMGVWERRWRDLREAGLTKDQAETVYFILEGAHAFGTATLSTIAHAKLEQVFDEGEQNADAS